MKAAFAVDLIRVHDAWRTLALRCLAERVPIEHYAYEGKPRFNASRAAGARWTVKNAMTPDSSAQAARK